MKTTARWHGECTDCGTRFRVGPDQIRDLDLATGIATAPCAGCETLTGVAPVPPDDPGLEDALARLIETVAGPYATVTRSDLGIEGWTVRTLRGTVFVRRERRLSETIANAERAMELRLRA